MSTQSSISAFKYFSPVIVFVAAWFAFNGHGWICYLPLIYGYVVIPLIELFVKPKEENLSVAEEALAKEDRTFDYALYFMVAIQVVAVFVFANSFKQADLSMVDIIGRTGSMGLLCGLFGINVGHELGHRNNTFEQWMAKISLMTSLYVHFFIEHNKGHHKNVATPLDPSSARKKEMLYTFYFRTIVYSYASAWHIANDEMKKRNVAIFHWKNEMLQAHIIQLIWLAVFYFSFGSIILLWVIAAAFVGILHLETVNYIEHYGLSRKETEAGRFERAMPHHSWNSSHIMGRLMLFELSRHSDHHYLASRKYQILKHHETAPQLPTGYPGSMLLSLVPPLWFAIMDKQMKKYGIE
jgi:alkane 1-monooxygenase